MPFSQIGFTTLEPDSNSIAHIVNSYPREVEHEIVEGNPYFAVTRMDPPLGRAEVERIWSGRTLPDQLSGLWSTVASRIYLLYSEGSTGLIIHDPRTSFAKTKELSDEYWIDDDCYHEDDIIVGEFQGGDERLVYSPEDGWLIYSAIEERDSWLRLGESLDRFLIELRDAGGTDGDWDRAFFLS